jgi:hypothetical protein
MPQQALPQREWRLEALENQMPPIRFATVVARPLPFGNKLKLFLFPFVVFPKRSKMEQIRRVIPCPYGIQHRGGRDMWNRANPPSGEPVVQRAGV